MIAPHGNASFSPVRESPMTFKDHFSGHASSYASSRPGYPRDLVATVARLPREHRQALHWFDFDRFFAEVQRVLAPGGAVALWTYNLARVEPAIDALMDRLAHEIAAAYWP